MGEGCPCNFHKNSRTDPLINIKIIGYKIWRRERDLNPRSESYFAYSISSRALSASQPSLLKISILYKLPGLFTKLFLKIHLYKESGTDFLTDFNTFIASTVKS